MIRAWLTQLCGAVHSPVCCPQYPCTQSGREPIASPPARSACAVAAPLAIKLHLQTDPRFTSGQQLSILRFPRTHDSDNYPPTQSSRCSLSELAMSTMATRTCSCGHRNSAQRQRDSSWGTWRERALTPPPFGREEAPAETGSPLREGACVSTAAPGGRRGGRGASGSLASTSRLSPRPFRRAGAPPSPPSVTRLRWGLATLPPAVAGSSPSICRASDHTRVRLSWKEKKKKFL